MWYNLIDLYQKILVGDMMRAREMISQPVNRFSAANKIKQVGDRTGIKLRARRDGGKERERDHN